LNRLVYLHAAGPCSVRGWRTPRPREPDSMAGTLLAVLPTIVRPEQGNSR
jgi:hypothetical protein